jgi:hypothetical protein
MEIPKNELDELAIKDTVSRCHSNFHLMKLELRLIYHKLGLSESEIQSILDNARPMDAVLSNLISQFPNFTYKEVKTKFPTFMSELADEIKTKGIDITADKYNICKNKLLDLYKRYKVELKRDNTDV